MEDLSYFTTFRSPAVLSHSPTIGGAVVTKVGIKPKVLALCDNSSIEREGTGFLTLYLASCTHLVLYISI